MKISKKFTLINFLITLFLTICLSLIFLTIDYSYQKQHIINELKNINRIFVHTVDIFVNNAIENHLKTKAEIDKIFINNLIYQYRNGKISKSSAKDAIKSYLRNIKIGDTGYIFIWNIKDAPSKVILDLHPEIEGEDVAHVDFVQEGARLKQGYMEYLWANPSDPYPKWKSMYLEYIKEFDWVIAYSSYKEEFYKFINIENLNSLILEIKSFGFGNSYIIDYYGNIFIHKFERGNFYNAKDKKGKEFVKEIINRKEGLISYYWIDYTKDSNNQYKKIAYFSNIDKFKLIIISSVFIKDSFAYYQNIFTYVIILFILFTIFTFFLNMILTKKILKPFFKLQENIQYIISTNENFNNDDVYKVYHLKHNIDISNNNYDIAMKNKIKNKSLNLNKKDEIIFFTEFFDNIIKKLNQINLELKIEYERERSIKEDYEKQKNFNDEILNLLPSSIVIVDINGKFVNVNNNFLQNFLPNEIGLNNLKLQNYDIYDILDFIQYENQDIKSLINEIFNKIIEEKRIFEKKIDVLIDGEKRNLFISAIPYFQNSEIKYLILKIDDITQELKKISTEAEIQKYEAFNMLIKGLSHDINNYTASIIGSSNLLRLDMSEEIDVLEKKITEINENIKKIKLDNEDKYKNLAIYSLILENFKILEEISHFLENIKTRIYESYFNDINVINESSKKVSELINKLNIFSKKKLREFQKLNLLELLNKVIMIAKSSFGKEVQIEFIFNDQEDYFINGLEDQIESMLLNIFINSYHAMTIMRDKSDKKDKNILKIVLEKIIDENISFNKISIIDNGVGINSEIKNKIFDPFFTTKSKDKGSGLGLYIVNNIIRIHGGKITFESKPDEGTSFYIYLPIFDGEDQNIEKQKSNIKEEKGKNENKKVKQKYKRILVIDDEEKIRFLLKKILEKNGFSVKLAESGFKGIEIYSNDAKLIDLVILDLIMPGINGKETLIKLKEINPNLKVIMISGYIDDEKINECLNLGVKDFLQKPFDISSLIEKINDI
ncbi:MAG: cache domain-containing protein [Exilispira sp.]|jgi:signal transduction histidine kinase/CheY-like chemotaxis protein|nr:cache domain-containing protein [Exilispira sp.]